MLSTSSIRERGLAGIGLLLVLALVVASDVRAQSRVGTTVAPFLTMGTGARGTALGNAYTALATGAEALYWNPAGISRAYDPRNQGAVFFSHTQLFEDVDYNAFGMAVPIGGSHVLGLSLAQVDYGRMDVRTVDRPDGTGETFGAADLVMGLSYARPLTNTFFIGGTVKYVRQSIYDMTAATAAFDVGFVLQTDYFNGLRIGASIMNFGGKMEMSGVNARVFTDIDENDAGSNDALPAQHETDEWDLPLSFKFGVAVPVVRTEYVQFNVLSDAHQTNDNALNADAGAEMRFTFGTVNFDLRAGYRDLALGDYVDSHQTYGGGVDLGFGGVRFGADFSYVPFDSFGNVSTIDLRLYF